MHLIHKYLSDEPKILVEFLELRDANYNIALGLTGANFEKINA